jgi:hypothetical protein
MQNLIFCLCLVSLNVIVYLLSGLNSKINVDKKKMLFILLAVLSILVILFGFPEIFWCVLWIYSYFDCCCNSGG